MIKTAAIIAPAFLLIYHIILPLALVSSTNVKAQNRRRIASNEEAIEVRRRLQSVNLDAIPSITETATEVLIDPVMGPWCVSESFSPVLLFLLFFFVITLLLGPSITLNPH